MTNLKRKTKLRSLPPTATFLANCCPCQRVTRNQSISKRLSDIRCILCHSALLFLMVPTGKRRKANFWNFYPSKIARQGAKELQRQWLSTWLLDTAPLQMFLKRSRAWYFTSWMSFQNLIKELTSLQIATEVSASSQQKEKREGLQQNYCGICQKQSSPWYHEILFLWWQQDLIDLTFKYIMDNPST